MSQRANPANPGQKGPDEAEEPGKPRSRADERRQSLVEVTYQLLAEKGFEGLRVRDVAARAGVNIATLHYYFNTKEALIQGVVDYLLNLFINLNTRAASDPPQTAAEEVQQMFADVHYQMQKTPEMFVVLTELHLHAQRNEAVQASLHGMYRFWRGYLGDVFRMGVEQGVFLPDLDIPRAASTLMALIEGLSLLSIAKTDELDFEQIGADFAGWLTKPQTK